MLQNNRQRAYLILGASGGIGSAAARKLVSDGHRVLLAGRRTEILSELSAELGQPVHVLKSSDFAGIEAAMQAAAEVFEHVHGVANCIGSLLLKPAHLTTEIELRETIETHLLTAFGLVRAAAKTMRPDGGSVVLCSSAAAQIGLSNHEAIAAAKGAIEGLTRSAAMTYAKIGLRVNAVAPGLTRTPLTARITGNEKALESTLSLHPRGRIGEAEDVADAIAWLLGAHSDWVTGQILGVDGGLATLKPMSA